MSKATRFSGRLSLRIPTSLHGELARAAEAEGVSINKLLLPAIASMVDWKGSLSPDRQGSDRQGSDRQGTRALRGREANQANYEKTWDEVARLLADPNYTFG